MEDAAFFEGRMVLHNKRYVPLVRESVSDA